MLVLGMDGVGGAADIGGGGGGEETFSITCVLSFLRSISAKNGRPPLAGGVGALVLGGDGAGGACTGGAGGGGGACEDGGGGGAADPGGGGGGEETFSITCVLSFLRSISAKNGRPPLVGGAEGVDFGTDGSAGGAAGGTGALDFGIDGVGGACIGGGGGGAPDG